MATPEENRAKLKKQIDDTIQAARTLRDEIRVELHLAGMDAKDQWRKIEPQLSDVEKLGTDVSEATRQAATKVKASFNEFRESLKRRHAH